MKNFKFFAVALATVAMFSACEKKENQNNPDIKSTVPEVAATDGAYTVVWNAVDYSECNGLVFAGNYNNYNLEPANMAKFEKIEGYTNWYKAVITPTEAIEQLEGKPCALAADGTFPTSWDHQWIGSEEKPCEVVKGEVEFQVEYSTETKMIVKQIGTVVYVRSYQFKVDPCIVEPEYDITFNLTVAQAVLDTAKVYVVGDFVENGWTPDAYEMTRKDANNFTATVKAKIGREYKYVANGSWDYEMVVAAPAEDKDCSEKSGNLTIADVTANDNIYGFNGVNATICGDPITVKAKVPATWTDTITAWVWPTDGDGSEAILEKDGDWYVYNSDSNAELNIIFKNGKGWNGNANQTEDINGIVASTCYQLAQEGETKATATAIDCE